MEKLEAHVQGKLHKEFSVFIFNDNGELLPEQRAEHKYHGASLWTNTSCSHPQLNEDIKESAIQRLYCEMDSKFALEFSHAFIYKIEVENNLIEHDYDDVFVEYSNDEPKLNKDEVQSHNG